ncbi:unnamed protein product, partial [Allacma fusca]
MSETEIQRDQRNAKRRERYANRTKEEKQLKTERRKALRLNYKNVINHQQRETRELKRDKINENRRFLRYENIESANHYLRLYCEENREAVNEQHRSYRYKNIPYVNEQQRAYYCQNIETINTRRSKRRADNTISANDQQRPVRSAKRNRYVETHYSGLSKNVDESLINEQYC